MKTAGLLLAAGQSKRFGQDNKLLAPLRGMPLVSHAAHALRALPLDHYLAVVSDESLESVLSGFEILLRKEETAPLSVTLAEGARYAIQLGVDRLLVVLGDMPLVQPRLLSEVMNRCTDERAAAASDGQRVSPPACFPGTLLPQLTELSGDQGAGNLIKSLPPSQLVMAGPDELVDIDVIGDLEQLHHE